MFALAASSFSGPSETFIRDHARMIAPGRTLLICHEPPPIAFDEFIALSNIDLGAWPKKSSKARQLIASMHRYWRRYFSPRLPKRDQQRLAQFFEDQTITSMMAEYGPTGVMLLKSANAAGVPLYVHFHGFDVAVMSRLPFWKKRYQNLFENAAGVIGPSQYIVDRLIALGCPQAKAHVCACGIDPARFLPTIRNSGQLVAVGRLVAKKAPHITIAAFGKISSKFPDARLDIIGDGPLFDKCQAQIEELGLVEKIKLHGRQSHAVVSEMMGKASGFLQHSVTAASGDVEGMPVSILEAMACALPVVSTRHSGIQEAVLHGETGLLVDEMDLDAMAEAIALILSAPEKAKTMGHAARKRVIERYTQEKTSERLRSIMRL